MRTPLLAALAVTLAGPAQAADFEGVIDTRLTMTAKQKEESGGGHLRLFVSAPGSRIEMQMTTPMGEMRLTMLHLKAKPGVSYLVNDEKKVYSEIEGSRGDDKDQAEKITVKRLGNEQVAGYDCVHALVTDEQGEKTEIWSTKALGGAEAFWTAQAGEDRQQNRKFRGMAKSLRDAGVDGWPLKFRSWPREGQEMLWETTKVDRTSVPSSLFSLAGYTKAERGTSAMGQMKLSPEQQKKMEEGMKQQQEAMREAMKKMSPEQRKQMEEMMKSMQGGDQGKRD
jgi:hypothetical protein